ncbi:MAG: single-stranded DNA-binding protein [Rectinema sp.]|nr:single-stranded DNA-binding protein [Rectinema sp.]
MFAVNRIVLGGLLTRDPEQRLSGHPGGYKVVTSCLAVHRRWRTKNGSLHEESLFIDIDFVGKAAEYALQNLRRGSPIVVDGRLCMQRGEDKQGTKRSSFRVLVESVGQFPGEESGNNEVEQRSESRRPSRPASSENEQYVLSSAAYGRGHGARLPDDAPEETEQPFI